MSFFGDLERLASDLYPYRWPITIGAAVLLACLLALAYRRRLHLALWRHRLVTVLVAAPLLAAAVPTGWYVLSPLWERSYLEEASPLAAAAGEAGATPTADSLSMPPQAAAAFSPRLARSGQFMGADDFHFGRGRALLIETAPGRYTLRFEDFSVRNGPDLFVYLSPRREGYHDEALDLGRLKATDGAFNYEVPPGADVSQFQSAIVWCKKFSVLFALAPLEEM